jgi:hypothetical protein
MSESSLFPSLGQMYHDMMPFIPSTTVYFHPRKHTKKSYAQHRRDKLKRNNKRKFNSNK